MNKTIIMSEQHTVRLFQATVDNFKRDLTYLQGCLAIISIEREKTHWVTQASLEHVKEHMSMMQEMLNDFEYRLGNCYERN